MHTFLHLHKLVLFVFGWKEEEYNKHTQKIRNLEHQTVVQKEVTMWAASHKTGFVKGGRPWVVLGHLKQQEEKSGSKRRRTSGGEERPYGGAPPDDGPADWGGTDADCGP